MTEQNYWAWWTDKLAGKDLPMSEGTPYAGFYRWVRKDKYGGPRHAIPVAYWPGENGDLCCRIGDKDVSRETACDNWISIGCDPVQEDWYRDVAERGHLQWRDGMPTTGAANEPPPDNSFEGLRDAIEPLATEAARLIKEGKPIKDQAEADRLSNGLIYNLAELAKKVDEQCEAEWRPVYEASRAIKQKWAPLVTQAETYKNLKYALLTPWMLAVKKRAEEEARTAAAAGEPAAQQARPRAGTRGRAMSLKVSKRAEITDYDACLNFFRDSPDVRATVQDLANRAVRTGIAVPGTKVAEDERVV